MAKRNTIKWVQVDWSKSNKEIARDLRCSESLVWRNRTALGIPHFSGVNGTTSKELHAKDKVCQCGAGAVDKFRGEWVCYDCLIGDDIPTQIEPLQSPAGAMVDEAPCVHSRPIGHNSLLSHRECDAAYRRLGHNKRDAAVHWFAQQHHEAK